jgi:hypothetical protein
MERTSAFTLEAEEELRAERISFSATNTKPPLFREGGLFVLRGGYAANKSPSREDALFFFDAVMLRKFIVTITLIHSFKSRNSRHDILRPAPKLWRAGKFVRM